MRVGHEKKKILNDCRSLISSINHSIPSFQDCGNHIFILSVFLFNRNKSEKPAHRKWKGVIRQWSLDADVPIPKRPYVILRAPSSTK